MKEIIKRAVFLDFDGVLFDTVKEAYCVLMIALGRASDISGVDLETTHFQEFHKYRFLIGPAWNYYYLSSLIDEKLDHPSLDLESAFRSATRNPDPDKHRAFEKNFFTVRNICRETDFDNWLSLTTPYTFVNRLWNLVKVHQEKFFLITTRDRESVLQILRVHHLDFCEESVFGKEKYEVFSSKRDIIRHLIDEHQIEESIFVDDLEDHFIDCGAIENLLLVQARWGYVALDKKEDNSVRILQDIENLIQGKNVWT